MFIDVYSVTQHNYLQSFAASQVDAEFPVQHACMILVPSYYGAKSSVSTCSGYCCHQLACVAGVATGRLVTILLLN